MTKLIQKAFPFGEEEELKPLSLGIEIELLVNGKIKTTNAPRTYKTTAGLIKFCKKLLWNKAVDATFFKIPGSKKIVRMTKRDIPFKEAQRTMPTKANKSGLWGFGDR